MTDGQRQQIIQLRKEGCGYTAIAKELDISRDTVRSFCRRNRLAGEMAAKTEKADEHPQEGFCRECGKELHQTDGIKKKVFCCRKCREKWWHEHPEEIRQRAVYAFICAGCGKKFTAYGNSHRKYCSHDCYVKSRFKGGDNNG